MERKIIEIEKTEMYRPKKPKNNNRDFEDVERIVNNPKRQMVIADYYRKRRDKYLRKMFAVALLGVAFSLVFCFLGCVGWLNQSIAFIAFFPCSLFSAFRLGMWFENVK